MKKMIALIAALMMVLSLAACAGASNGTATSDQADLPAVSTYSKDFDGLSQYIVDRNKNASKSELFYDILGADNGVRYVLNGNSYVEIYDFSSLKNDTAKDIVAAVKADGKFTPLESGTEMTAVITDSGKYIIAWDASRSYDYLKNVATDELKSNW